MSLPVYEGGNLFLQRCDKLINAYILSSSRRNRINTISHNLAHMKDAPYVGDYDHIVEEEKRWLRGVHMDAACNLVGIDFHSLVMVMIQEGYNLLSPNDIEWWKNVREDSQS